MSEERVLILLKPGASAEKFLSKVKTLDFDFKLEKVLEMGKQGATVVACCNKAAQTVIKSLSSVEDIEQDGTVHIMKED